MAQEEVSQTLNAEGLCRFQLLQRDAVSSVTERFYATHGSAYERFGPGGREACREDLAFHLEFLRPVLEFGILQPMVDYLRWLDSVLAARAIPTEHLALSLDWLAEFFDAHMDVADSRVVVAALHAARAQFLVTQATPLGLAVPEPWLEASLLEATLLAGNQDESLAIVAAAMEAGHGLVDIELHIIQPALYRIGEQWQANRVSVAQEHMATAIAQVIMTIGLLRSPPPPAIGKRVLLACVEGNNHMIGLRMVADAFQLSGWDIQYLGANVPTTALLNQVSDWQPDLVGLSVSFPQQLKVVKTIIAGLQARFGSARPPIIVGGLAINRFSQLASAVGADASGADALAAVDCGKLVMRR